MKLIASKSGGRVQRA